MSDTAEQGCFVIFGGHPVRVAVDFEETCKDVYNAMADSQPFCFEEAGSKSFIKIPDGMSVSVLLPSVFDRMQAAGKDIPQSPVPSNPPRVLRRRQ